MGDFARFRGTLGGFNRKDVCAWIESSAKEQRKSQEGLQQELTRLIQENGQLRQENLVLKAELTDYEALSLKEAQREQAQEQAQREQSLMLDSLQSLYDRLEADCGEGKTLLAQTAAESEAAAAQNRDRLEALNRLLEQLSDHLTRGREELPDGASAQ